MNKLITIITWVLKVFFLNLFLKSAKEDK